jgi:hypothetical protein
MADVTITDALLLFTKVNEKIVKRIETLEKSSKNSGTTPTNIGDNKTPVSNVDDVNIKNIDKKTLTDLTKPTKAGNTILNKILGELETTADNQSITNPQPVVGPQIIAPIEPVKADTDILEKQKQTEIIEEVKPVYIEDFSDKAIKHLSKIIGRDVNKKSIEEKKKEGIGSVFKSILDTFVGMGKGILSSFTGAIKLLGPLIKSIGPLISAIGPAAAIAAAGFVGWEIGTYLDKKFQISDKIAAGITQSDSGSYMGTDSGSSRSPAQQTQFNDTIKMEENVEQLKKEKRDLERAAAVRNERTFEFKGNKYFVGDSRTKIPQLPPDPAGETKPPQLPTTDNPPETDSTIPTSTTDKPDRPIKTFAEIYKEDNSPNPVTSIQNQPPSSTVPKEVSVVSPQTIIPPIIKPVTDNNKPNEALKVTQESNSNFKTYAQRTHDLLAEQIKISTQTNKVLYEVADKLKGDTNIVTSATTISNNYGNTSGLRELQGALS